MHYVRRIYVGIPHECCNGIQSDHNAGCRGKSDLTDTDGIKYQTVLGEIMSKISFKAGNMLYPAAGCHGQCSG